MEFNPLNYELIFMEPKRLTPYSSWREHIPFALGIVDWLKPKTIVELGTYYGDSYCAFCQAVQLLELDTRCYAVDTWAGDVHSGPYGKQVLDDLRAFHDPLYSKFSQLIQCTFDEALSKFENGSIDLLHIDGTHVYEAVKHDFETWLPKVSPEGIVLFHDINMLVPPYGVWKLWDEIKRKYTTFSFMHCYGLGVMARSKTASTELNSIFSATDSEAEIIRNLFSKLGSVYAIPKPTTDNTQLVISNNSIPGKMIRTYETIVSRMFPTGSKRRRIYELPFSGVRIILNDGWRSFFANVAIFFKRKRLSSRTAINTKNE